MNTSLKNKNFIIVLSTDILMSQINSFIIKKGSGSVLCEVESILVLCNECLLIPVRNSRVTEKIL